MFCPNCGTELKNHNTCKHCGWSYEEVINAEAYKEEKEIKVERMDADIKHLKKSKKTIVAVIVIVLGLCVFCQTDIYKFGKAQIQISNGDYNGAISTLSDYNTPKAIAMRKYAEVTYAKKCFMKEYRNCTGSITDDSEMAKQIDKFQAALRELKTEKQYIFLPPKLRKQYNYYSTKMEEIDEKYQDTYSYFVNAQMVFLNPVIRNRNENFTLSEQQENLNVSEEAYNWITSKFKNLDDSNQSDSITEFASELLTQFVNSVEVEIEQCKDYIKESLKKYDMDDTLYLVDPDKIYASYICEGLKNVVTTQNIEDNALTLIYSAKGEELAYYFEKRMN